MPYFNPEFQNALRDGERVAGKIEATLKTCLLVEDEESQIYKLVQKAKDLRYFDASAVCRIGIVGDSGVGES